MSKGRYNPKFDDDEEPDKSKMPNAADIYLETPPPPPIPYRRPQGGATLRGGHLTVGAFTLTDLGLQVDGNASQDDWTKIGEMLFKLEGSIQWLIGDWLAFGENVKWGDISMIADALGRDRNTLYGYVSVCREFDMLRRRNTLSFGHHREVMGYEPDQQDIALAHADEHKLSVAAFRKWIREQQQGEIEPPALPAKINQPLKRFESAWNISEQNLKKIPPGEIQSAIDSFDALTNIIAERRQMLAEALEQRKRS